LRPRDRGRARPRGRGAVARARAAPALAHRLLVQGDAPARAGREPAKALGLEDRFEDLVASWYEAAGYRILDRNWRSREGELDLVVSRGRTVVFCEVKTRRSTRFGAPVEAVTATKQRRIRTLALQWLAAQSSRGGDLRFDVASVLFPSEGKPVVEVLEAVF
jgi:putative endonuclease